jgi:hypothetical protein
MFVLAHVSSMNTSRSGFRCGCSRRNSSRLSATSGRFLSEAMRTFFGDQTKLVQRSTQRLNGKVRPQLRFEFPQCQVRILSDNLTHPIRNCGP